MIKWPAQQSCWLRQNHRVYIFPLILKFNALFLSTMVLTPTSYHATATIWRRCGKHVASPRHRCSDIHAVLQGGVFALFFIREFIDDHSFPPVTHTERERKCMPSLLRAMDCCGIVRIWTLLFLLVILLSCYSRKLVYCTTQRTS